MKIVRGAESMSHGGWSADEEVSSLGVKILKALDRLFLVVTDGLKMSSSPFSTFALAFFSSCLCVKVRPSFLVLAVGLNL